MTKASPERLKKRALDRARKLMKDTVNFSIEETLPPQFRVSSFPYCPILALEAELLGSKFDKSYKFKFYTDIGTAVHSLLQQAILGTKGGLNVYGFWVRGGGKKLGPCFYKDIPKDQRDFYRYEEIAFNDKGGLSGHQDLLWQDEDGAWYVFEFKTSGSRYVKIPGYQKYLPHKKHVVQVETYCVLLKRLYNINVQYHVLVYFSRDEPLDFYPIVTPVTQTMVQKREAQLVRAIKGNIRVQKFLKNPTRKAFQKVFDARPCHTKLDYLNLMTHAFFGDKQCNYHKKGLCYATKAKKFADKLYKELVDYVPEASGKSTKQNVKHTAH